MRQFVHDHTIDRKEDEESKDDATAKNADEKKPPACPPIPSGSPAPMQ
jgi:hypothetical protein